MGNHPHRKSQAAMDSRTSIGGLAPHNPTCATGGSRPELPGSGTHLLGIVAAEAPLDPWVRDSLVDGYALQGDPWTQWRPGDKFYRARNGPQGTVS